MIAGDGAGCRVHPRETHSRELAREGFQLEKGSGMTMIIIMTVMLMARMVMVMMIVMMMMVMVMMMILLMLMICLINIIIRARISLPWCVLDTVLEEALLLFWQLYLGGDHHNDYDVHYDDDNNGVGVILKLPGNSTLMSHVTHIPHPAAF